MRRHSLKGNSEPHAKILHHLIAKKEMMMSEDDTILWVGIGEIDQLLIVLDP